MTIRDSLKYTGKIQQSNWVLVKSTSKQIGGKKRILYFKIPSQAKCQSVALNTTSKETYLLISISPDLKASTVSNIWRAENLTLRTTKWLTTGMLSISKENVILKWCCRIFWNFWIPSGNKNKPSSVWNEPIKMPDKCSNVLSNIWPRCYESGWIWSLCDISWSVATRDFKEANWAARRNKFFILQQNQQSKLTKCKWDILYLIWCQLFIITYLTSILNIISYGNRSHEQM